MFLNRENIWRRKIFLNLNITEAYGPDSHCKKTKMHINLSPNVILVFMFCMKCWHTGLTFEAKYIENSFKTIESIFCCVYLHIWNTISGECHVFENISLISVICESQSDFSHFSYFMNVSMSIIDSKLEPENLLIKYLIHYDICCVCYDTVDEIQYISRWGRYIVFLTAPFNVLIPWSWKQLILFLI